MSQNTEESRSESYSEGSPSEGAPGEGAPSEGARRENATGAGSHRDGNVEAAPQEGSQERPRKGPRLVRLRAGDADAIRALGKSGREPFPPGNMIRYHLHESLLGGQESLLGRIGAGAYSPRRLAAEVGQDERGERGAGNPYQREPIPVRLEDWGPVEEAAGRANRDLLLWTYEVAQSGSALPSPICRCTPGTIIRAAGREIAEQEAVFSRDVAHLASDIRPGPDALGTDF